MANTNHLMILEQGVDKWNDWRRSSEVVPDLSEADLERRRLARINLEGANLAGVRFAEVDLMAAFLSDADLRGADLTKAHLSWTLLTGADLTRATLTGAHLWGADLTGASLTGAVLDRAMLGGARLRDVDLTSASMKQSVLFDATLAWATLRRADLTEANLTQANLFGANLADAVLRSADLSGSSLSQANLTRADLSGSRVYAVSAWDVTLTETNQSGLLITPREKGQITVDSLEIAQFIYLLLENARIRNVIDQITSKVVLILGRFTPARKIVLDSLRESLRARDYSPVVFDFENPISRDLTETVSTLAHLARFVVADITDARGVAHELMAIVPNLPSVPVQPLLHAADTSYAMFEHFRSFPWVLPPFVYATQEHLLDSLNIHVIGPAETKVDELRARR